jgi:hypothetical protein
MPESSRVLSSRTHRTLYQDCIIIEGTVYHLPLMSAEGGDLCQHLVRDYARSSARAAPEIEGGSKTNATRAKVRRVLCINHMHRVCVTWTRRSLTSCLMRTTECQKQDRDSKAEPALSGARPPVEEVSHTLWLLAWVLLQGKATRQQCFRRPITEEERTCKYVR